MLQGRVTYHYGAYDPKLTISGSPIAFLGAPDAKPFKNCGWNFTADMTPAFDTTSKLLLNMVDKIDALPLEGHMKLWLYDRSVTAKHSWPLISDGT